MCGIFALLNSDELNLEHVRNEFYKGKRRGPEFSKLDYSYMKMILGFHRLAINGLNDESNQPIVINDIVLISFPMMSIIFINIFICSDLKLMVVVFVNGFG